MDTLHCDHQALLSEMEVVVWQHQIHDFQPRFSRSRIGSELRHLLNEIDERDDTKAICIGSMTVTIVLRYRVWYLRFRMGGCWRRPWFYACHVRICCFQVRREFLTWSRTSAVAGSPDDHEAGRGGEGAAAEED